MKIVNTITQDKLHLSGLMSEPDEKKSTAIIHIHGMGGDPYTNSWYPHFHKLFPENDIAFLAGNNRGTGSITMFYKEPNEYPSYGNSFEIFEECIHDIDAWVKYAHDLGYKNIFISAHSLAPSKAVYYVNQKPILPISGLILISPVDMLGISMAENDDFDGMMQEAHELMKRGKGNQILSQLEGGEYHLSAKTFINLFTQGGNSDIFCYTDRDHDWSLVNNINIPVLAFLGTNDGPITAISSADNAANTLKEQFTSSSIIKTQVYVGAGHTFEGFEDKMVTEISNFTNE